jgi:hypothetical protein
MGEVKDREDFSFSEELQRTAFEKDSSFLSYFLSYHGRDTVEV